MISACPAIRWFVPLTVVILMGCDRDPMIRVYDAPKDPVIARPQQDNSNMAGMGPARTEIHFEVPEGWIDLGKSGLRSAEFDLDGDETETDKAEVTVVFAQGDKLSNLERWLGQLDENADAETKKVAAEKAAEEAEAVRTAGGVEGELIRCLCWGIRNRETSCWSLFCRLDGVQKVCSSN